ncbi:hypothetical protein evm_014016 [Chilo suppressalis]|nr:hypothetical protein evm_014016 [Chilo suppressalis]
MSCIVRGCRNVWSPGSSVKFHSFPTDPSRRSAWLAKIQIKGMFYNSARICSEHFKSEDYDPERPGFLLKNAVPHSANKLCVCCNTSECINMPSTSEPKSTEVVSNLAPMLHSQIECEGDENQIPIKRRAFNQYWTDINAHTSSTTSSLSGADNNMAILASPAQHIVQEGEPPLKRPALKDFNVQVHLKTSCSARYTDYFFLFIGNGIRIIDTLHRLLLATVLPESHFAFPQNLPQTTSDVNQNLENVVRILREEAKRTPNQEISKHVRYDLRCPNTLSIERAIEQNRGSKVFVQSLGRSHLTKLTTANGEVVVSKLAVLSEVKDFYSQLYASHASRPDPGNEDSRATLTRHFTEDLPEVSIGEIEIALGQLKNGKAPGEDGATTELLKAGGKTRTEGAPKAF